MGTLKKKIKIIDSSAIVIFTAVAFVSSTIFIRLLYLGLSRNTNEVQGGLKVQTIKVLSEEDSQDNSVNFPSDFPDELPVYPNASLNGSWNVGEENIDGTLVVWETDDEFGKVKDFYKQNLYYLMDEVEIILEKENYFRSSFVKGNIGGFINITNDQKKTIMSITFGVKK